MCSSDLLRLPVDVGLHLRNEALGLADPFTSRTSNDRQSFRAEHDKRDDTDDDHFAEAEIKHDVSQT